MSFFFFFLQDNDYDFFQWIDPKICDRGKEIAVILSNQKERLKEKLRMVEKMKEIAEEKYENTGKEDYQTENFEDKNKG